MLHGVPLHRPVQSVFLFGKADLSDAHSVSRREGKGLASLDVLQTLVTKQTGPAGKPVNTLYIANKMKLKNEMYFALLLDRGTMGPMIIACSEGRGPTTLLGICEAWLRLVRCFA